MIKLYPQQVDPVNRVRASFKTNKSVLLQAPTGFGKSVVASYILRSAIEKRSTVWFVVPRIELMHQMSAVFRSFGIKHTYIAQKFRYYEGYPAAICTLETLKRRMKDLPLPTLAVLDETHWGGASIDAVVKYLRSKGVYILGLSATPARTDNMGMADWYDDMVCGPSVRSLINDGLLSDYRLFQPDVHKDRHNVGDPATLWREHAEGLRTVAFCSSIAHAIERRDYFNAHGIKAEYIEGRMDHEQRSDIIKRFADGEIKILTNNMLLTFGFDLALASGRPDVNVEALIDMAKCNSLAMQMQKWGRGLRKKDKPCPILDCAGNSRQEAHGFPCAERDWVLEHGDMHKRDVEQREATIRTILCKGVGACYRPARIGPVNCPHCGRPYEFDGKIIRQVEGQLVEVTPDMIQAEKKDKRMEVGMARTLDDLIHIAQERGYKRGWVYKMAAIKGIKDDTRGNFA